VLFPPHPPAVLCVLQCDINTSSDHPCFEAVVVLFFPPFMFLDLHTNSGFSGVPVIDFSRRNSSVSWIGSKFG